MDMDSQDWYFEDFAVGQTWASQYRTITEADVVAFAAWSWDTNRVHTDAVSASTGRFGERIAHGVLGLSVAMGLVSRLGVFEQCSIALLGVDDWTFYAPILLGDSVRCELEITGVRAASNGVSGVLERTLVLTNQHEACVQSGRINLLVSTRPKG
jgi:acyl dehydratase